VEPFYFGPAGRELFGIYHPPVGTPREEGVVICPPLFAEYLRCHTCLKRLAAALAASGVHALRFDYHGTGDASGDFEETTPADWQNDIRAAAAELQALSGVRRVRLIGVRLGATLAARVAVDAGSVQRVILWDPIVDGAAYVRQLQATHRGLLESHGPAVLHGARHQSGVAELVGFRVSDVMLEHIASLSLPGWAQVTGGGTRSAAVVLGAENFGYDPMIVDARSAAVSVAHLDFDCNWTTHSEGVLFPHDIIAALTDEA
jgi:pimeloyl-ACP methyl ester carboxylesterase